MKKNIIKYCTLLLIVVALGCFSSCSKDDDNSVHLDAFGPSPALRGGELRFLGSNLDKVTEIILPNEISVKEITQVSNGEIVIKLPQNVVPGYIILKTPDGDITTKTKLTLSEPITITKFYKTGTENVTSVKAGDELTFEGDYLNLIREVVFTDNVVVSLDREENGSYPRDKFTVKVPLGAQTGKIALSNGAEIPILVYTETDLTVASVSVTSILPATIKAGTELTIKGVNLQLVEKVKLSSNLEITVPPAENPYADLAEIKITVPENTQDGDVLLVAYSGLETNAGAITMMLPTVTSVLPNPVKGGTLLTIKGTNLDLVANINFPNVENAVDVVSKTVSQITINVPVEAADGNLVLNTNSGKTVEAAYTTVKSAITNITPTSLVAGNDITITGTNLDLVRSVTFGGNVSVDITPTSPTSFEVTVPTTATSGTVKLTLVNNASVTSSVSLNVTPSSNPVIASMPASAKPGSDITLTGTNLNTVEAFYVGTVKVTSYSSRTATSVTFTVPASVVPGIYTVKMVNYSGDTFYSGNTITITGTDPVTDLSLIIFDFENGLANDGRWNGVGQESSTGGISGKYYEITAATWGTDYWWFAENWMTHPSVSGKSNYAVKIDVRLKTDVPAPATGRSEVRLMFSGKVVNILPYLLDESDSVWTTGGEWKTITIPLTAWSDLSDPTPASGGEWGMATWINGSDFTGFCVDNIRYHKIN
ncbi:glycan-binding surface protein [Dysgonomonas reticulitermitis]